jgi:6-phosphogluconate dehydrogenase
VSQTTHWLAARADYIEHAHLSILCEIRGLLHHQLGMSNDDIADLFEQWYNDKVSTYLLVPSQADP